MALKPENPVVGGNVLRRQAIESPNYTPGVSGWVIKQDGSAEFNNLTIRGTFNGTDFVINSAGFFLYSNTPAAGNLVNSVTNFPGTDQFGNHYLTGSASYSNNQAVANVLGVLFFYTGSLAGGWAQQGSIQADTGVGGQIDIVANALITGTLSVNGSTSTGTPAPNATSNNGIANGTITGTSGAASAGTAHTHGPGSFSVTDGHHSHDIQNHLHPL